MMELMRKAMLSKVSNHNSNETSPSILPALSPNKSVQPNIFDNPPLVENVPNNHANTVVKPKFDLMAIM